MHRATSTRFAEFAQSVQAKLSRPQVSCPLPSGETFDEKSPSQKVRLFSFSILRAQVERDGSLFNSPPNPLPTQITLAQ
jgi:hypothetical protein